MSSKEIRSPAGTAEFDDFLRVDMRVGTVIKAEEFRQARAPAYKLWIDFGDLGVRQSSAQITRRYRWDDLVGSQVVAVTNLAAKRIAGFRSEVLVLGAVPGEGDVILLRPEYKTSPGTRIL